MTYRCDAYGAESQRRDQNLGGYDSQPVAVQNICRNVAVHRFAWVCEHGHRGRIVSLCEQHWAEFTGQRTVPWNVRRDVRFCPRCQVEIGHHRCRLELVAVS